MMELFLIESVKGCLPLEGLLSLNMCSLEPQEAHERYRNRIDILPENPL